MTRTISVVLLGVPFLVGFCPAQPRYTFVKGKVRCPDEIATTGYYRNYSYGFSISIPRGLKGFWNSAICVKDKRDCVCMGDHGRFIPVDRYSYLQVFVEPQNSETIRESIDEEIGFMLRTHEEKKEPAEVVTRASARLGGESATRLRLKYQDAKTRESMLEDSIIGWLVDRDHGGWLYSITSATPEKLYPKHKALFYSIMRSWRYRSVPQNSWRKAMRGPSLLGRF
jgi:hypothetical protein